MALTDVGTTIPDTEPLSAVFSEKYPPMAAPVLFKTMP
jgi:hypothetical protein